jgi:hypothetical protein
MAESCSEEEKNAIVQALIGISRRHPTMLIFAGTIVWHKRINKVSIVESKENENSCDRSKLEQQAAQRRREKFIGRMTEWQQRRSETIHARRPFRTNFPHSFVKGYDEVQTVEQKKKALMSLELEKVVKNTGYALYDGDVVLKYSKQSDFHEVYQNKSIQFIPGVKVPTIKVWGKDACMIICGDYNYARIYPEADIWITISDCITVHNIPPTRTNTGFAAHIAAAGDASYCKLTVRSTAGSAEAVELNEITKELLCGELVIPENCGVNQSRVTHEARNG